MTSLKYCQVLHPLCTRLSPKEDAKERMQVLDATPWSISQSCPSSKHSCSFFAEEKEMKNTKMDWLKW